LIINDDDDESPFPKLLANKGKVVVLDRLVVRGSLEYAGCLEDSSTCCDIVEVVVLGRVVAHDDTIMIGASPRNPPT
jgi:hypothetical protein